MRESASALDRMEQIHWVEGESYFNNHQNY